MFAAVEGDDLGECEFGDGAGVGEGCVEDGDAFGCGGGEVELEAGGRALAALDPARAEAMFTRWVDAGRLVKGNEGLHLAAIAGLERLDSREAFERLKEVALNGSAADQAAARRALSRRAKRLREASA